MTGYTANSPAQFRALRLTPENFNKFRASAQNLIPRLRDRDGQSLGSRLFTPRVMFTGPVVKDRVAFTQSLEYRYERVPVNSLPPLQRDTRNETFDSYSQIDAKFSQKQTAIVSFALFPQKLDYFGLNTFTPQASPHPICTSGISSRAPAPIHHQLRKPAELTTEFQTI